MGNSATVKVCYGIILPIDMEVDMEELETLVEKYKGLSLQCYGTWDYTNYIIAVDKTKQYEDWGAIIIEDMNQSMSQYNEVLLKAFNDIQTGFSDEEESLIDFNPRPHWVASVMYG
jgi:hypothetical protein